MSLLLGTVLGGLGLFVWNAVSWMMLPWHHAVYRRFNDEDAVARALLAEATVDGVYGVPAPPQKDASMDRAARDAADMAVYDKMKAGPLVTVVFQRRGYASIAPKLVVAMATGMVVSFVFTLLLQSFGGNLGLIRRAALVGSGALGGILATRLPDWNWHGFSKSFVAVQILDMAIGCYAVGLIVGAVTMRFA